MNINYKKKGSLKHEDFDGVGRIEICLDSGLNFDVFEKDGVLHILSDNAMFILPDAANKIRIAQRISEDA